MKERARQLLMKAGRVLTRGESLLTRASEENVMNNVVDVLEQILNRATDTVLCLETGTIRSYHEQHESTRRIGEVLGSRGHLTSVDIEESSIAISKDICRHLNNISWVLQSSVDFLRGLSDESYDLILLDSANDPDLIFEEFELSFPRLRAGGTLIVDDAGIHPSDSNIDRLSLARKGHRVWHWLRQNNVPYELLPTTKTHGTQLKLVMDDDTAFAVELLRSGRG